MVGLKDWIDHRPSGLNRVLTGKERSIAGTGGGVLGFESNQLTYQPPCFSPDELLPCEFDASGRRPTRTASLRPSFALLLAPLFPAFPSLKLDGGTLHCRLSPVHMM